MSFWSKVPLLWQTSWSQKSYNEILDIVNKINPDIAHIDNTMPLISPSIYYALRKCNVPIVQSLRNYRFFCVKGTLYRNNKICELCLKGKPLPALRYKCYHNSRVQSLALVFMLLKHQKKTYMSVINSYIALTEFSKNKYIKAGIPGDKIYVKPNFLFNTTKPLISKSTDYAIYVGRLSEEKGLKTLLNAWQDVRFPLVIIGDGPLRPFLENRIRQSFLKQVKLHGFQDQDQLKKSFSKALFFILPSECYEGFGRTLMEAYSMGVPVLASRLGSLEELIHNNQTGSLFSPGDSKDLAEKANRLVENRPKTLEMGENARKVFEEEYTSEKNYSILMDIYQKVLAENRN